MKKNKKLIKEDKDLSFPKYLTILFIIGLIVVVGFEYAYNKEVQKNVGCYNFHVKECEQCHARNLTFALCSGFCFEPRDIEDTTDLPNGGNVVNVCSIHPKENCTEHVPRHCLL